MQIEDKRARREAARLKLREKYLATRQHLGPRAPNEGERLPVGQIETVKWPVLDLGIHPKISTDDWSLRIDGAVRNPTTLSWSEFNRLEQVEDVSDFHCVTTWSKLNMRFSGVPFWRLVEYVQPEDDAHFILCSAYDDYTVNLSLAAALEPDVLLAHSYDGQPLPLEHGGPCRMITPKLYAWKGAKWIKRIEFRRVEELGYWEKRGYSNTANPWLDDRYSGEPVEG